MKKVYKLWLIFVVLSVIALVVAGCVEEKWDNPLDPQNPETGGKPTGLKAEVTGIGEVTLTWDDIKEPKVEKWNVYRSADDSNYEEIAETETNSYIDTGLSNATVYFYKVSPSGGEKQSDAISVRTFDPTPTAPTGLTASITGIGEIGLSWDTVTLNDPKGNDILSGYNIYRSDSESGAYNKLNTEVETGTSYTDSGLSNNTQYWYKVGAVSTTGDESNQSEATSVTTFDKSSTPTGTGGIGQISLSWTAPSISGIIGYKIYKDGSFFASVTETSYTDTGLGNNESHSYTVSVTSSTAESNKSESVSVTTYDKPGGLTATAGYQQVSLSWDEVSANNLKNYKVYQSTTSGSGYQVIASPTTSSYINTGLTNDTTYYYQVSAVGTNDLESDKSVEVSAKTLDAPVGMVKVPAGEFTMGSDSGDSDEKPVHTVYLDAFFIDKYEVTNKQFAEFLSAGNDEHYSSSMKITKSGSTYTAQSGYEDHPVVYVNWHGAKAYCEWQGKRLPTEAEWEKAARGTDARKYPWGEDIDGSRANYWNSGDPYDNGTTPVGYYDGTTHNGFSTQDSPSPYGAYDMAGNVWEWCADWYDSGYYSVSPQNNPQGPDSGTYRVLRGGGWNNNAYDLRPSNRNRINPSTRNVYAWFRCSQ